MKNRAFDHSKYQHWIDPNEVTPYQMNAKQHTEKQIKNICNSIRRFGWQQDTVLTADNVLVIGHGRRLAALKLGCEMPYHVIDKTADELTDEDIRELRIADNQTNAETGMDFDMLNIEIEDLDFDGFDFDFDTDAMEDGSDFFSRENRNDTSREEGNDEYNEFLDKFEQKKTTDDCYTPEIVYNAIAEWVAKEYGIDQLRFVRPFYPGGDYRNYSYPANCAVVDNPPFSILAEIISWYAERNIRFFLFAPQLTLFSSSSSSCCLPCGVDITYENGAVVPTSFVTNLENNRVRVIPELYKIVEAANDKNLESTRRTLPKYKYPDYVLTAAMCNYMCSHDTPLTIRREDSVHIRHLDSQKEYGDKAIFGSGYLLSEKAAAEKAAAEKASAHVWELSEREWQIIKSLGHD